VDNQKVLDEILLSENVVEKFKKAYLDESFKQWLLNILPEVEDCKKQKQDTPWHIYNCLDHILHSVEEINKQTKSLPLKDRRMLAYVMFFHDIGKPACHLRRYAKAYGREVDSFFGHNKKSVEIAKRSLKTFGFVEEETKMIEMLVHEHDIFMFITEKYDGNPYHKVLSKELINEEISLLNSVGMGKKLMQYLVYVGRADNNAQNPDMTAKSLRVLDLIEKLLEEIISE